MSQQLCLLSHGCARALSWRKHLLFCGFSHPSLHGKAKLMSLQTQQKPSELWLPALVAEENVSSWFEPRMIFWCSSLHETCRVLGSFVTNPIKSDLMILIGRGLYSYFKVAGDVVWLSFLTLASATLFLTPRLEGQHSCFIVNPY